MTWALPRMGAGGGRQRRLSLASVQPLLLAPCILSVCTLLVAAIDRRCHLPFGLDANLTSRLRSEALSAEEGLQSTRVVYECLDSVRSDLLRMCGRLYAVPVVRAASSGARRHGVRAWREQLGAWAEEQSRYLGAWARRHPACANPGLQLRITNAFLSDVAAQMTALVPHAAGELSDGVGTKTGQPPPRLGGATGGGAGRWLARFHSAWTMALYYVACLNYLSVDAFGMTTSLARMLHGHLAPDEGSSAWQQIALGIPSFRLRQERPLQHDALSAQAVHEAVRQRLRSGRRIRFVEVGVFRANLSFHVWQRAAAARGVLEMHLVDNWGLDLSGGQARAGSGSDMAGLSNSSLYQTLLRRFSRTGRCAEVPHRPRRGTAAAATALADAARAAWTLRQPRQGETARGPAGDDADADVNAGADVFFHRTSSVGASEAFPDGSLDVVYIDADHKWWSVVQDLAAWWPKLRRGGVMLGHDFHLNSLMERSGDPGGDLNDVPMAVQAFFRAPHQVTLHSGFVWSVEKLHDGDDGVISLGNLCELLRERMPPHRDFEACG
eukprot:TRINITY_DN672_c2_g1_i1.p1 TRINITY_DN672_c2_g1~~TRINITY_DN672_c2_g1_i1.p1  ORF type:complete len:553 (-),score=101.76 TRINITY_DN672_c2_g1_i1:13-1671(-)